MRKLSRKEISKIIKKINALSLEVSKTNDINIINQFTFEDEILELNNPELSFWYAYLMPGANVEKHEQVVFTSRQVEWCCRFARYVRGANVGLLTGIVRDSKYPLYNYLCARDIPQILPGFDITPFEDNILELESTKWSEQFLYNVKGARKELHENVIRNNEAKKLSKRISRTISKLKKSS